MWWGLDMIRFILKNEQDEYATAMVNSEPLETLLYRRPPTFKIVGQEHVEEFYAKINPSVIIADRVSAHEEPQFPEKYTPVIARDHRDSYWVAVVFIAKHANSFETGNEHFDEMTLLKGNEHLVETKSTPPFYWIPNKNEPMLIKT
jgi:hypothetical protein